jgi:AAA ATPase domain
VSSAAADPLVEVLLDRLEPEERELLRRCSVPRSFDAEALDGILMPGARDQLDQLVEDRLVIRTGSGYRLAAPIRDAGLRAWAGDPQALREFSAKLAEYWRTDRPIESLYHLIVGDPVLAAKQVRTRFEAAEAAFDLASCETVVALLDERDEHLDATLRRVREELRARHARRIQFSEDWYRSRRFLERSQVRDRFQALLAGEGGRAMVLHAPGGMGKTMHLRWFVTHVCVPRGIACARIDFDDVVATAAVDEPWLVLLAFAEQLERQLADDRLKYLLTGDAAEELPRLWRTSRADLEVGTRSRGGGIRERLVSALNDLPSADPIVLVIDTLEVASLRTGASLAPLVAELRALQEACPAVRLLFAGRFDIAHEVPEHADFFDSASRLPLDPFDREERVTYLGETRGLTDPALIDAIADHSDGNPFKLALIADLVEGAEGLDPDDLEAYGRVDLMYLLERVLLRIDEMDVRWVIRYGAMTRWLDRELLERAMAPVLAREMRNALRDEPERGLPRKVAGTWARRGAAEDLDAVWEGLKRYAKEASWLTVKGSPPNDTLHFGVDVLQPIRRLVREQAVFRELHEGIADEYRRRAEQDRARRADWTGQELYHRLLADPSAGAPIARERLARALPDEARTLIDHLLSREYAVAAQFGEPDDDAGPGDTRPAPPEDLLAELLLLAARVELPELRDGQEQAWDRCRRAVVRLDHLQHMREARLVPVRAALRLYQPRRERRHRSVVTAEWRDTLREAIESIDAPDERVEALTLLAELVGGDDPAGAEDALSRALAIASAPAGRRQRLGYVLTGPARRRLRQATAETVFQSGDVRRGLQMVRQFARGESRDVAAFAVQEARFLLAAGQPAGAARAAADAATVGRGTVRNRALALRARALLEALQPNDALEACASAPDLAEMTAAGDRASAEALAVSFAAVSAAANALKGQVTAALTTLDRAERLDAARAGAPARRLAAARLQIELRAVGDFRAASGTLDRVWPLVVNADDYDALLVRLYRVEWQAEGLGERGIAAAELRLLIADLVADGAPRSHRVRAAIAGLALGDPEADHLEALVRELELVQPPAARLGMLRELRRVARIGDGAAGERLRDLTGSTPADGTPEVPDPGDARLLRLTAVEVERAVAGNHPAADVLRSVRGGGLWVDAEWIEAAARIGLEGGTADRAHGLLRRLATSEPGRAAAAALAVAGARLGRQASPDYGALDALAIAEGALAGQEGPSRQFALLAELRGRQAGDLADANRAASLYDRLGDRPGVARIEAIAHGREERSQPYELLIPIGASPPYVTSDPGSTAWQLAELFAQDWRRLAASLAEQLKMLAHQQDVPLLHEPLRLVLHDHRLHVVPWELALAAERPPAGSLVRAQPLHRAEEWLREVFGAFADAPSRTPLEAVLDWWRAELFLPRALVVDALDLPVDDATAAYADAGIDAMHVQLWDVEELARYAKEPINVLHLRATLSEARGGAGLDLTMNRGPAVPAKELRRIVAGMRTLGAAPLIVLDPPDPPDPVEATRQLCLRNTFAGELFELGLTSSVIAAGLLPGPLRRESQRALADVLALGMGIGEATATMRARTVSAAERDDRSLMAAWAIAAFTVHPDLPAPFMGRDT